MQHLLLAHTLTRSVSIDHEHTVDVLSLVLLFYETIPIKSTITKKKQITTFYLFIFFWLFGKTAMAWTTMVPSRWPTYFECQNKTKQKLERNITKQRKAKRKKQRRPKHMLRYVVELSGELLSLLPCKFDSWIDTRLQICTRVCVLALARSRSPKVF